MQKEAGTRSPLTVGRKGSKHVGPADRLIRLFYASATGSPRTRHTLAPLGIAFFVTVVALFVFGAVQLDRLLGFPQLVTRPLSIIVSVPLLAGGALVMFWAMGSFVRVKGSPAPFNPPSSLVRRGPYSQVRNPMLTGLFLLMFGLGVFFRSLSLVCILTPFFILLNALELKLVEEPELEQRLGDAYVEYRREVPMFIPRPRSRSRSTADNGR